eukprot:m.159193 g.159193  ORF g.159193 m.159193 type:complete len:397 (-) comp17036_c2_seq4:28-1218(-)
MRERKCNGTTFPHNSLSSAIMNSKSVMLLSCAQPTSPSFPFHSVEDLGDSAALHELALLQAQRKERSRGEVLVRDEDVGGVEPGGDAGAAEDGRDVHASQVEHAVGVPPAAVIRRDDDKRLVQLAGFLKSVHDLANVGVDVLGCVVVHGRTPVAGVAGIVDGIKVHEHQLRLLRLDEVDHGLRHLTVVLIAAERHVDDARLNEVVDPVPRDADSDLDVRALGLGHAPLRLGDLPAARDGRQQLDGDIWRVAVCDGPIVVLHTRVDRVDAGDNCAPVWSADRGHLVAGTRRHSAFLVQTRKGGQKLRGVLQVEPAEAVAADDDGALCRAEARRVAMAQRTRKHRGCYGEQTDGNERGRQACHFEVWDGGYTQRQELIVTVQIVRKMILKSIFRYFLE